MKRKPAYAGFFLLMNHRGTEDAEEERGREGMIGIASAAPELIKPRQRSEARQRVRRKEREGRRRDIKIPI